MAASTYTADDLSADLRQAAAGDRAAFQRVYRRTSAKLFGICLRVAGDRDAAEDILHEVYLIAWRKAPMFDEARASPITWLAVIARNRAVDWMRAESRRATHSEAFAHAAPLYDNLPLSDEIETAETHSAAIKCLDELGEDQRHAIRHAFLEGLTYSKLAERLAVPLATVKSRIRRGLIELRKCLGHG